MIQEFSYVVIVGTAFGNKTIHGPFDYAQAEAWIETNASGMPTDIVRLEKH